MSTPEDTEPTVEQTREQAAEAEEARERIAALRRAAALRERTARAFDTRTELWQEAGLSSQIDKAESRKAMREAVVLLILLAGVLFVFANRNEIPLLERRQQQGDPLRHRLPARPARLGRWRGRWRRGWRRR